MAIAAFRAGHFGSDTFAIKATVAIVGACFAPLLYLTMWYAKVPGWVFVPAFLSWFAFAFAPAFWALLYNLFTGHRFPGAQWYDALWRIYAILGLWIVFGMLNERIIRPWWRRNSDKYLGSFRQNTVGAQARQLMMDKRAKKLDGIKERVIIALKKKKLAQKTIEDKNNELVKVAESIKRAESMVEKAKERLTACEEDATGDAEERMQAAEDLLQNAESHRKGIHGEISRCELDLQETEGTLQSLQHEWTEALHIENYSTFYR